MSLIDGENPEGQKDPGKILCESIDRAIQVNYLVRPSLLNSLSRMNQAIMRWPNAIFYRHQLEAAPLVAKHKLSDLGDSVDLLREMS